MTTLRSPRAVVLLALLAASPVRAAEVTRVASSFEEKDPFGMFFDFTFDRVWDQGKITREWYQQGKLQDVDELRYSRDETRLGIDTFIGLFRDLELHVGVPIVFQQDRKWVFAKDTTDANSTINRICGDARGTPCATPGAGDGRLFEVGPNGQTSFRGGLGDFTFGLAFNAFNQKKDDTKPTWTLRFDYTAPTSPALSPSTVTGTTARGAIGERVHKLAFSTAVSKRIGEYFEPYLQVLYVGPIVGPGFYSNCDDPRDERMARAENCGAGPWTRAETGIRPAHFGLVQFGNEISVFERPDRYQRVVIDLRAFFQYTSEGRYYNEVSDLMKKLLYTSDFGTVGAQVGFVGQAAEFVSLRAYGSVGYNTERYLTNENIGKDITSNGTVDITGTPQEINPNYDFRVDRTGRRFRMEEQVVWRLNVSASLNF